MYTAPVQLFTLFALEENIMKLSTIRKFMAIVLIGAFSQFALADNASATKTIAEVLAGLNHFPSDADKTALMAVANDDSAGRGLKAIANAVSNIQHAATAEDKEMMNRIIGADQASADAKALAEIVLGINHMASADAKAVLQAML